MFLEIQTLSTNKSRLCGDWEWGRYVPGTFLVFDVTDHHQGNGQIPVGSSQAPFRSGFISLD